MDALHCDPERDPPGLPPERDADDERERLARARRALERLADELRDTDEVLDETLDDLDPRGRG